MNKIEIDKYLNKQFNFLNIISEARTIYIGGMKRSVVDCECTCGNKTIVTLHKVMHGYTKSCGCKRTGNIIHGKVHHPLYKIWDAMRYRCKSPNAKGYNRYGGRGITVYEYWKHSFISFFNWAISNGWECGLQIDRIDNNGNYEPSNCRWVTPKTNSRNRKDTVYINLDGKKILLAEAIENKLISKTKFYRNKIYQESLIGDITT
jgi:hypothetical protein